MSIQVNNTDNQLNIIVNGVLDVYNVKTIKSVSRAVDASGNHYMSINFIANDKNNSVRIPLSEVTSPVTWTNDTAGAIAAVEDIRDWLSEVIDVEISEANDSILVYGFDGTTNRKIKTDANGELQVDILSLPNEGQQTMANSISVALASNQAGVERTPTFLRPSSASPGPGLINAGAFSVSFASVGTANATVGGITLKPGETLNFDAGAINNTLSGITYSTSTAGAELIIITLT
jgi:hypothetical protein